MTHINRSKCIPKVKEGNLHRSNHAPAKEIFYPCRQGKAKHENWLLCRLTIGLHSCFFRKIFIYLADLGLIWGIWDHVGCAGSYLGHMGSWFSDLGSNPRPLAIESTES